MCKPKNLEIELKQEEWNRLYVGKDVTKLLRKITGHDINFEYNNDYGGVYYTAIINGKKIEVVLLYPKKVKILHY